MSSKGIWHDRTIVGPFVYGFSALLVGCIGYVAGYLMTDEIRCGIYVILFMDTLLVLYLLESRRNAVEGERQ